MSRARRRSPDFASRGRAAVVALMAAGALACAAPARAQTASAPDEIGLTGPGVAGPEAPIFRPEDLRSEAAPLFAIAPDALDAPVFTASDLAPAISPPVVRASSADIPPPPWAEMQAAAEALKAADDVRLATDAAAAAIAEARQAADAARKALSEARQSAAAAKVVAPTPAAASIAFDRAALRAALDAGVGAAAKGGRATLAQRRLREEIAVFYATREDAPLWIDGQGWTDGARAAVERLSRADEDGLDLGARRLAGLGAPDAAGELALSEAVIAYGQQASGGRVDPLRVSNLITARPEPASATDILTRLAAAEDAGEALRGFNPPHPGYAALRAKLAELRRERPAAQPAERIPLGPTLKIGMRDPRVPLIRARLGLGPHEGAASDPGETLVYDTRVAEAVKDFQRVNGLPASGQFTPRTIAALSGGEPSRLENELIANMERWRWLPRDLGETRIEVNIPDYTLAMKQGDATIYTSRVVVGKPESPTPVFSDRMRYIVVNPSWTMPPSILKKEALPNLAADPNYYAKRGYEVIRRGDSISVRQPPGERNALGHLKFMFPNNHAVYLHDTPSRSLFGRDVRAFSHGCVRVDQPFKLAEAVLGGPWSEGKLRGMVGRGERSIKLGEPLPIHLTYFTTFVGEDGRLHLRDDLYGFSRRLRVAMGLER